LSRTSSLCACFSVLFFQFISSTLNKNKKKYASFGKPKLIHPCSNYFQILTKLKSKVYVVTNLVYAELECIIIKKQLSWD